MSWNRKAKNGKNLVQKTLGLKEDVKPLELQDNSLVMNDVDKDIYHDMTERYEAMAENLDSGLQEYAPFEHLSEDIFGSLFKYNAQMHDEEDMKGFSRVNHKIMDNLMESDDYQRLRKNTKFDLMSSAIGTEALQGKAMEQIQSFKDAYLQQQQTGQPVDGAAAGELIEQLNNAKNLQDQIDDLEGKASSGQPLSKRDADQLARLQEQLMDAMDDIDDNADGQKELEDGMTGAMDSAAKNATEEITEVRDVIEAWGLDSSNNNKKISLDARKKAIERIRRSARLKGMTDLIGRMKKIALNKKKRELPDGHSIKTIELGNKIESVTPSELMKLAHPATKKDFTQRYHQKQLMQYKKNGMESIGQGPIIVLHDKSWSMEGNKDHWSTALSLATLEVAQKEKRNYAYIPYESKVIERAVKNIPAGELDPNDVMDIAELNVQGGTNFMDPLNAAVDCLKSDRYKKGDVLFITDGDCGITETWLQEFNKQKKDMNFFVNTVLINIDGGASRQTVDRFSDNVTTISSIADLDDASAAKIFNVLDDKDKFNQPEGDDA